MEEFIKRHENLIECYKKIVPFIIFVAYAIGYLFYKIYYWFVGIDIQYYISVEDFLFIGIDYLAILSIGLLSIYMLSNIVGSILKKCVDIIIGRWLGKDVSNSAFYSNLIVWFLMMVIGGYFSICIGTLKYSFFLILVIMIYMPVRMQYIYKLGMIKKQKKMFRHYVFTAIMCFIVFVAYTLAMVSDSITGKIRNNIEFIYEGKCISTENSSLCYLGETSLYYFLYDKTHKETHPFEKAKSSSVKFKH